MLKDVVTKLFPNGRFIDRSEIKLGATIARGGSTLWGDPLTKGVIISRPVKVFNDGSIGSDLRDYEGSFFSEQMKDEWLYEIDTDYPTDPNHITDHHFNAAVLKVINSKMLKPATYNSLMMGSIVLASSGEVGDIKDENTYWVPEITLFVVGGEDEYGWFVESETPDTDPYPFTAVVKVGSEKENLWKIKA